MLVAGGAFFLLQVGGNASAVVCQVALVVRYIRVVEAWRSLAIYLVAIGGVL